MTWDAGWLQAVALAAAKSSVVLSAASAAAFATRRRAAAVRARVWALAFVALLTLPLVETLVPGVSLPLAPYAGARTPPPELSGPGTALEPVPADSASGLATRTVASPPSAGALDPVSASPDRAGAANVTLPADADRRSMAASAAPWLSAVIPVLWLCGVTFVLLRYAAGRLLLARVRRRSTTVDRGPAIDDLSWLCRRIRRSMRIEVRRGAENTMPATWGVAKPVILLPSSIDRWPAPRRRTVMTHELAHIVRRDALVQAIVQVALAVYWFNPLTWYAAGRLRVEREHACDDFAVQHLGSREDYASELLQIARAFRPLNAGWAGVSMARPSELEGRLLAILDPRRTRTDASARLAAASWIGTAILVLSLGAVRVASNEGPADSASNPPVAVSDARPHPTALPDVIPANVRSTTATGRDATGPQRPSPEPAPVPGSDPDGDPDAAPGPGPSSGRTPARASDPRSAEVGTTDFRSITGVIERQSTQTDVATQTITGVAPVGATEQPAARTPTVGATPPDVVGTLIAALDDENGGVRAQAAQVLGDLGSRDAVSSLVARLSDPSTQVRAAAARALGDIGDAEAADGLAGALGDASAAVRVAAMTALIELNDPRVVDPLLAALDDAQADVRQLAASGLADIGDRRAIPGLIAALDDQDGDVRQAAVSALQDLDAREAVPALIARLDDADADVREQATGALADLSAREAVPGLMARALDDEDADVRERAVSALGDLQATEAADALRTLVTTDPDMDVRERAAQALGDLADREAVPALIEALGTEDADVREAAASSLADLADRRAAPALIAALQDADADVRERAAYALGDIGDPSAIPPLQALMSDADADVRLAAVSALADLTRRDPDR